MAIAYQCTADGYFVSPMEDGGYLPNNATYVVPPDIEAGTWPRWTGEEWELVEDHRERGGAVPQPATEYWLPGDTHETPARTMSNPGPLPEGALLEKPAAPEPTPEEQQEAMKKQLTDAVQARLDTFAQTRGYDGIMSAASYATSTDAAFKAEGERAVALRDATWRQCYTIMADVLAGNRQVPTAEELFVELPVLSWE